MGCDKPSTGFSLSLAVLFTALAALAGCQRATAPEAPQESAPLATAPEAPATPSSPGESAERRTLPHLVSAPARLHIPWQQQAIVSSSVSGKVATVAVRPGDAVETGQELLRLESLELEQLQLELLRAKGEVEVAARSLAQGERASTNANERRLFESRSLVERKAAENAIIVSKLRAMGMSPEMIDRVEDAGQPVRTLSINSPRGGIVSEVNLHVGQAVDPLDPLVTIVDLSKVDAIGEVPERECSALQPGLPVELNFAALPGQSFAAKVSFVGPKVDPQHATSAVYAELNNDAQHLRPGMSGQMVFTAKASEPVVAPSASDSIEPGSQSLPATEVVMVQGQIELPSTHKVFVSSNADGRLLRILVDRGERVEAGQPLAAVQSLALCKTQLDLLLARNRLRMADQAFDRLRRFQRDGTATEQDVWQAQADRNALLNTVLDLERRLALLGLADAEIARLGQLNLLKEGALDNISDVLPIVAPTSGWLAGFELVPGQLVTPHEPLFEIQDTTSLEIHARINEQDAARMKVGQSVTVTVDADPDYRGSGVVSRLSPVLSGADAQLSIWCSLANRERRLKEGMLANVRIHTTKRPPHLAAEQKP